MKTGPEMCMCNNDEWMKKQYDDDERPKKEIIKWKEKEKSFN